MPYEKPDKKGMYNPIRSKGMAKSGHRRDGMTGDYDEKEGKVDYGSAFKDLGESYDAPSIPSKNKKHYPALHVSTDQIPALEGAAIGSEVVLKIRAKVTGASQRDDKQTIDFELRQAALEE